MPETLLTLSFVCCGDSTSQLPTLPLTDEQNPLVPQFSSCCCRWSWSRLSLMGSITWLTARRNWKEARTSRCHPPCLSLAGDEAAGDGHS